MIRHNNTKLVNLWEVSASLSFFCIACRSCRPSSPCRLSATLQGGTENWIYCTSILNLQVWQLVLHLFIAISNVKQVDARYMPFSFSITNAKSADAFLCKTQRKKKLQFSIVILWNCGFVISSNPMFCIVYSTFK